DRNPQMLLKLAEDILKKHKKEGADSPLKGIDMIDMEKKVRMAREKYTEVLELRKRSERLTGEVQKLLGIHKSQRTTQPGHLLFYTTRVRDVLKGLYRGTIIRLSEWGFSVIERERGNNIES
ncbi:MAG: hypothetical protein AB1458_03100, partial [Bacteroidota bacterium]